MDKTSYSEEKAKSRAIHWVLRHYKFVKPSGERYDPMKDYYGFFPRSGNSYTIRDLSGKSASDVDKLSTRYHIAYYFDSYGVFSNMWPEDDPDKTPAKKLYGGLDWQDLRFIERMLERNHLVIAEFVFVAPPTDSSRRAKAEELLGMKWSGWTGRFFHDLDVNSPNRILPGWIPSLYEKNNETSWPYTNAGIILVDEKETLLVLEYPDHLATPYPVIMSEAGTRKTFGVSNNIRYPSWFDITFPASRYSEAISWYHLDVTAEGAAILEAHDLPARFPAVIRGTQEQQNAFYFAGDFGHTPTKSRFVRFKGARYAELFLSDLNDPTDKSGFFYGYYLPMMKTILTDYQAEISRR